MSDSCRSAPSARNLSFSRLLDALSETIEFPTVIDAAEVIALDPGEVHGRVAVGATIVNHLWPARSATNRAYSFRS